MLNTHLTQVMTVEIGEDGHSQQLEVRIAPTFDCSRKRFAIRMDGQKLDAHRCHSFRGAPNRFLNIQKLQIEKDALAPLEETLPDVRASRCIELEPYLHEGDLILHLIHQPFGIPR